MGDGAAMERSPNRRVDVWDSAPERRLWALCPPRPLLRPQKDFHSSAAHIWMCLKAELPPARRGCGHRQLKEGWKWGLGLGWRHAELGNGLSASSYLRHCVVQRLFCAPLRC